MAQQKVGEEAKGCAILAIIGIILGGVGWAACSGPSQAEREESAFREFQQNMSNIGVVYPAAEKYYTGSRLTEDPDDLALVVELGPEFSGLPQPEKQQLYGAYVQAWDGILENNGIFQGGNIQLEESGTEATEAGAEAE